MHDATIAVAKYDSPAPHLPASAELISAKPNQIGVGRKAIPVQLIETVADGERHGEEMQREKLPIEIERLPIVISVGVGRDRVDEPLMLSGHIDQQEDAARDDGQAESGDDALSSATRKNRKNKTAATVATDSCLV